MTLLAAHAHVVVRTPGGAVILVRRVRQGRVYYVVPGTEVLAGETPGAAAARAAADELGIVVAIDASRRAIRGAADGRQVTSNDGQKLVSRGLR